MDHSLTQNHLVFCLETVFSEGSLSLFRGDQLLIEQSWKRGFSHAEHLTRTLELALQSVGENVSSIRRILVDHGPGSFTGVRIGVTCARTIGFAIGAPIATMSSLELLAWKTAQKFKHSALVASAMNAFQGRVFFAIYERDSHKNTWRVLFHPEVVLPQDIKSHVTKVCGPKAWIAAGDAWNLFKNEMSFDDLHSIDMENIEVSVPSSCLHSLANTRRENLQFFNWKDVNPLYLRAPGAEERR